LLLVDIAASLVMGKRGSNQAAAKSTKKAKLDPALAGIADVIKQADHLPDSCRAMLVDMLPFSLSVPSNERHETQTWAVNAVETTLNTQKATLEAAAASEDVKLGNLKASESELVAAVTAAEAALDAQKAVVESAGSSLTEKKDAANAASTAFLSLEEEQAKCKAKLASTQDEKNALEPAFEAHFKVPMEEGAGPHFKDLQPFLKQIDMEASLLKAIPSVCSKSKEDRGSFDEVVLQELGKALTSNIAALGDVITAETSASEQREVSLQAARSDRDAKDDAQKVSAEVFDAAQKEQSDREALLANAKQTVDNFQPEVEAITRSVDKAKMACAKFESGPFTAFTTYKTQVIVEPPAEAAPAGA